MKLLLAAVSFHAHQNEYLLAAALGNPNMVLGAAFSWGAQMPARAAQRGCRDAQTWAGHSFRHLGRRTFPISPSRCNFGKWKIALFPHPE